MLNLEQCQAFYSYNEGCASSVLLVCDHASRAVAPAYQQLGLPAAEFEKHIAYDIGAAGVTVALSDLLQAPAVLSGFSRLLIDANRYADDSAAMPLCSDGVQIPANQHLSDEQKRQRVRDYFTPYHQRITESLVQISQTGTTPFIISVHSFTPEMQGKKRPWEIGVLSALDPDPYAAQLMANLRAQTDFNIGDNEPYHACSPRGYTTDHHAVKQGYPHLLFELRQDLVERPDQQQKMADLLHCAVTPILTQAMQA